MHVFDTSYFLWLHSLLMLDLSHEVQNLSIQTKQILGCLFPPFDIFFCDETAFSNSKRSLYKVTKTSMGVCSFEDVAKRHAFMLVNSQPSL